MILNKTLNPPTAAITAITKGSLLQGVPEGTGGYGDGDNSGTTYRECIPWELLTEVLRYLEV